MEKSSVAVLSHTASPKIASSVFEWVDARRLSIAPVLTSLLSLLYFSQAPSHDALLFSAVAFTGVALSTQFSRVGMAISILFQLAFFASSVFHGQAFEVAPLFFSTAAILAAYIGYLVAEVDRPAVDNSAADASAHTAKLIERVEAQESEALQFHQQIQSILERTTAVAEEREALLIEKKALQARYDTEQRQNQLLSHKLHELHNELAAQNVEIAMLRPLEAKVAHQEQELQGVRHALSCVQAEASCAEPLKAKAEALELLLKESVEVIDAMQKEREQLIARDDEMRKELSDYECKLTALLQREKAVLEEYVPEECGEDAAKYKQLRQQFAEKSEVLDSTRKQLFQAEQQVVLLQKQLAEPAEDSVLLTKEIAVLEECQHQMEKLYKKEIEAYEQLVEVLFQQINASTASVSHDHQA